MPTALGPLHGHGPITFIRVQALAAAVKTHPAEKLTAVADGTEAT